MKPALGIGIDVTDASEADADPLADRLQVLRETTRDHDWPER